MHTYVYAVYKIVHNKIIFVVIIYYFSGYASIFLFCSTIIIIAQTYVSAILDDIISSWMNCSGEEIIE